MAELTVLCVLAAIAVLAHGLHRRSLAAEKREGEEMLRRASDVIRRLDAIG